MRRIYVAFVLSLLANVAFCSTASSLNGDFSRNMARSQQNEDAFFHYLRPALKSTHLAVRIYYRCALDKGTPAPLLPFPPVSVQPALGKDRGLAAIRDVFARAKNVTVTADPGIVRIFVGNPSVAILATKVPELKFSRDDQYFPFLASAKILDTEAVKTAEHKLGVAAVRGLYDVGLIPPRKGMPHLPPSLTNVTLDEAYDLVAKTFKTTVVYGYCEYPDGHVLYDIDALGYSGG